MSSGFTEGHASDEELDNKKLDEKPKKLKLKIASAEDIFSALRSGDISVRYSILKAIAENSSKALSYGSYQGRSLVDELVTRWQDSEPDSSYRACVLAALCAFDDPCAVDVSKNDFLFCTRREILELAASRIAREPDEITRDFLRPFLFDGDRVKVRLAAVVLNRYGGLNYTERVRIAVLCPSACEPPRLILKPKNAGSKSLKAYGLKRRWQSSRPWGRELTSGSGRNGIPCPRGLRCGFYDGGLKNTLSIPLKSSPMPLRVVATRQSFRRCGH